MKTFGASAPLKELQVKFGFEPDRIIEVVKELREKERFLNLRKEIA
jgi:transketolase